MNVLKSYPFTSHHRLLSPVHLSCFYWSRTVSLTSMQKGRAYGAHLRWYVALQKRRRSSCTAKRHSLSVCKGGSTTGTFVISILMFSNLTFPLLWMQMRTRPMSVRDLRFISDMWNDSFNCMYKDFAKTPDFKGAAGVLFEVAAQRRLEHMIVFEPVVGQGKALQSCSATPWCIGTTSR